MDEQTQPRRTWAPTAWLIQTELFADQTHNLAPVGAAVRLPHDSPDDRADRLRVAGLDLLGGRPLCFDRPLDDRLELAGVRDRCQLTRLDDLLRIAHR